ncbi:MAG: hypothetical protein QM740_13250 [Acidovorax sp.]
MAVLVTFDAQGRWGETMVCETRIREALRAYGLDHGRWPLRALGDGSLAAVLQAYDPDLAPLRERLSVQSVDRVSLKPGHADWPELRRQFITEHTHADAETRYFLGGMGLFYVRTDGGYLGLLCEAEDWVVVPAGTRHFFDAGYEPDFDALRLFSSPDGWQAQPTGAPSPGLPLLDVFLDRLIELTGHVVEADG